ncbi:MAG: hypothetical protein AAF615_05475 [Pseudomonadota bacterium]
MSVAVDSQSPPTAVAWERRLLFATLASIPTLPALVLAVVFADGAAASAAWVKPVKFSLSLIVYLATLALMAGYLPERTREARWFAIYTWVVIACIWLELLWVSAAAFMGVPSHFNTAFPWSVLYGIAGLMAVMLTSAAAVYAIALAWTRDSTAPSPIRLGFIIGGLATFVLTLVTAGYLGGNGGHHVGVEPDGAPVWPFFGWSTTVGDLRPAHFLATHAIQLLPLLAILFMAGLRRPGPAVILVGAGYCAVTLAVFAEALMGRPFLSLIDIQRVLAL